jgi:hypothetical protein
MPSIQPTRIVSGCPILRATGQASLAHREEILHQQNFCPKTREGWDLVILSGRGISSTKNLSSLLQRALPCAVLLFAFATAAAGTVTGVIHNGTDGKIAAGVDVILIQLQVGMQPVVNTKSDAKGAHVIRSADSASNLRNSTNAMARALHSAMSLFPCARRMRCACRLQRLRQNHVAESYRFADPSYRGPVRGPARAGRSLGGSLDRV